MKFQLNPRFHILIYAVVTALTIGAVLVLFELDRVVHISMYDYGLRFDLEWATPYWAFMRLALGLLSCFVCLNVLSTVYVILCDRLAVPHVKSTAQKTEPELKVAQKEVDKKKRKLLHEEDGVEIAAIPMSCSGCGKVFTQALSVFDFKSGKPRLMHVCPYCNATLAVSGDSKTK